MDRHKGNAWTSIHQVVETAWRAPRKHGFSFVAMPELWTEAASSGVYLFTIENFLWFLEECTPA
jgi:hypothetical protein